MSNEHLLPSADTAKTRAPLDHLGPSGAALRRKALPRQVRDSIATLVADELRPGDPLPSEMAFAERLMVSRSTIREAMKLLEQEGLVETRQGSGRFASALSGLRPERPMTKFESLTKMMAELGYESTTKVVSIITRASTPDEQEAFSIPPGSKVVETRRLRDRQGSPCIYSLNVLDPQTLGVYVDAIDWSDSVVAILERLGHEIVASSAHISVVSEPLPEDSVAQIAPEMGPWLMVNEQCVTRVGRCVLISRDYHLGSMFSFSVVRRREDDFGVAGAT